MEALRAAQGRPLSTDGDHWHIHRRSMGIVLRGLIGLGIIQNARPSMTAQVKEESAVRG